MLRALLPPLESPTRSLCVHWNAIARSAKCAPVFVVLVAAAVEVVVAMVHRARRKRASSERERERDQHAVAAAVALADLPLARPLQTAPAML